MFININTDNGEHIINTDKISVIIKKDDTYRIHFERADLKIDKEAYNDLERCLVSRLKIESSCNEGIGSSGIGGHDASLKIDNNTHTDCVYCNNGSVIKYGAAIDCDECNGTGRVKK